MSAWWSELSIRNKLQIPIQLILLVVMLLIQYVALDRFEAHVLEGARNNAMVSADGVLNGLNMLMLNGIISDGDQRALYISKMGASKNIRELRVIRGAAVIDQFGPGLASEQGKDELDRNAIKSGKPQISTSIKDGRHELRLVAPFIAETNFRGTNCIMCHVVPEGTVTGAASITLDVSAEYALITKVNYWVWALQAILQVILYVLIGKLIHRVTSPILHSADIANRIAAGDLSSQIHIEGNDEVSQQLRAMQEMQNKLRQLVNEIKQLVQAAVHGNFSEKMSLGGKSGYMHELAELLNQMSSSVDDVMKDTVRVTTALAAGRLDQKITRECSGAYDQVKVSVNTTVDSLTRTVGEIKAIVEAAALRGDFSSKMAVEGKSGYPKELAELLNQLSAITDNGLSDVQRLASVLAQGDLSQTMSQDYPGAFGELKVGMNDTIGNLRSLVGQIQAATVTIQHASREISAGNSDLAQRTADQAQNLEKTSSSMEELTASVKQNAEHARQANQLAAGASDIALKGGEVVGNVVSTMSSISESSMKIADIISIIDGIAFQTNILALNAAVEAARAGEQGRGFAVVAAEVRNLAQRSAVAAKEIKALIDDSVDKVAVGTKQVDAAGKTMDEIVTAVQRVTSIMAEITAASSEQSRGIEQVNLAITQMDDATQQNSSLVEQAAAAAESMEEQAQSLSLAVAQFKMAGQDTAPSRSEPARLPAPKRAASAPARGKPATRQSADDEWDEF